MYHLVIDDEFILVLDMDGTLIKTGEKLNQDLAVLLKDYVNEDRILIATARHPLGVKFVLKDYFEFVPTISLNGAALHLTCWQKFDKIKYFPNETVAIINKELSSFNVITTYYGTDFWAVSDFSPGVEREAKVTGITPVPWRNEFLNGCIKILLIDDEFKIKTVRKHLSRKLSNQVQLSTSHDTYLEISPPLVKKCMFLPDFLKEFFNQEIKDLKVIFIGDSENDIHCAEVANESWTFPSSPRRLKDLSLGVLNFPNGEGVKEFLLRLQK
ncbi:MAG: HAD-IIB family hydrolase [Candidatus Heimdallarchaeota archaeon]|nr:MAG: HAD-IIB family hydrolase [Candidatus Heimdallarchaeota archaeon]